MTPRSGFLAWSALGACGGSGGAQDVVTTDVVLEGSASDDSPTVDSTPTGTTLKDIMTSTDGDPGPYTSGVPGFGFCSDGLHSDSEECDDGAAANHIQHECDPWCKKTRCGDEVIQLDEECDEGDTANVPDPPYDGCTEMCQLGPHCGDGEVQAPDEECEPGDSWGGVTCGAKCRYFTRVLFLSSVPTSGAMGGLTGMLGADERCQTLADDADIPGEFMAWLMVDGQALEERFEDFGDFAATVHIRTLDDEPLAESFDELVKKGPLHAVATTEAKVKGGFLSLHEKQVWTNITSDGLPAGGDCGDWKQADNTTARVGFSGYKDEESEAHKKWLALRRWTDTGFSRKCYDTDVHTYCIQVK